MARNILQHLLLIMLLFYNDGSAFPGRLKPTDSHAFTMVVAYKSEAILPCYAPELNKASELHYQWYKDGQEIGKGDSNVAQIDDGALRVAKAEAEDSGVYFCYVSTDIGTKQVNVTLIVLDAEKPPTFPSSTSLPPIISRRQTGSSIEFTCPAEGTPTPRLEWYKDDTLINKRNSSTVFTDPNNWTMKLNNLTLNDTGEYSCVAINRLGFVNASFRLEVTDSIQPDLSVFHPLNTTVKYGSSATFQCRVRSEAAPNIQWLKKVDDGSSVTNENHEILKVQGENYRVLRSSQVAKRPDGTYLNKLVIPEAKESDSGKYICLGANKMGYSFRSAFLTVLPKPRSVTGWSHHVSLHPGDGSSLQVSFPTVGGGLGIALAMAVVGIFYVLCRRRSRGRHDTSTDPCFGKDRGNAAHLLPSNSIEMDSMSKDTHSSLSKAPLIPATSPAMSEVELSGGVAVTKLYENVDNCDSCYKLRDDV